MQSFDYALKQPLKYATAGDTTEAVSITCTAPTSKHLSLCAVLRQEFTRAVQAFANQSQAATGEADESVEISGKEIMMMLYASTDCDIDKVIASAKELLTSGLAMVDGCEKLTKPLFDKLSIEDAEALIGDYLGNFILSSLLK